MIKRVFGRKLSRGRDARRALFRSLIRALVISGKITTTKAKAKAIQGMIDSLVSKASSKGIFERREVLAELGNDREVTDSIFNKIAPAFAGRKSGFTRLIPLPPRKGDMAEMVRMEWVDKVEISDKAQVTSNKKEVMKKIKDKTKESK